MDFVKYIFEEGLVMVAVLWIIGEGVKGFKTIDNKWILPILILVSLFFTPWFLGGYTPDNFVQAILVAGAAVLLDQTRKQFSTNPTKFIDRKNIDESETHKNDKEWK